MTFSSSASNTHMSSGWGARLGDRSGRGVGGCAGRPARWLRHPSFPARAHLQLRTPPRPISGAGRASSARASRRFSGNLRAVALTHRQRFILAYGTSPAIPSSWVRQMGRSGRLRLSSKVPFTCASSAPTSRRNIGRAKWHGTTISNMSDKADSFRVPFPTQFPPFPTKTRMAFARPRFSRYNGMQEGGEKATTQQQVAGKTNGDTYCIILNVPHNS